METGGFHDTGGTECRISFWENVKMKEAHWQRDRNIRDILVHLYEWHQLLLNWEENNKKGLAMPFIPAPYNWKTYGQMNGNSGKASGHLV